MPIENLRMFAIVGAGVLLSAASALTQQGPPGWNKYLYAQDATQQGKIDINLLNQMSAMASAQGYSLTPERFRRIAFNHSPTWARIWNLRSKNCRICIANRKSTVLGS